LRDVIEAHEAALTLGGHPGIRDAALIDSAIGRPYVGYTPRIHQKAAALAQSLTQNHGFVDGNKRTAFYVVDLFLARSGYDLLGLHHSPDVELENLVVTIAKGEIALPDIEAWFKARLQKIY
jgi:death on curing protein